MVRDVIASILVLGGSAAMLLGSVGLVRFPDVFTRMHAAAKAAIVGVIAITAAAAVEAGTVGGVLVLLLVVALLFLSGPLGMSLLARAAYHDPETPRVETTQELHGGIPVSERTGAPSVGGTSPALAVWLVVVWLALFGSFRLPVLIGGVLVAAVVAFAFRTLAPRWPEALLHPVFAARFVGHFSAQLVASTWDVLRMTLRDPASLRPAILVVPLRTRTRNEVTLLMNAISFTPGTVALELHDWSLYVHVLDADDPEAVVREIVTMEGHIMRAFGGHTAIAADTGIT